MEALVEGGREGGGGGVGDEAEVDEVAEVHTVLAPVQRELVADEGGEGEDAEAFGGFGVGRGGVKVGGVGADAFVEVEEVDGVANLGVGAVEEGVDGLDVAEDEADGFEGEADGGEVVAMDEEVDVRGVANGGFVDAGDVQRHGVAPGDGVGEARGFKGGGGAEEALVNLFHGGFDASEGEGAERGAHGCII